MDDQHDTRIQTLLGIRLPIIQAPMAGSQKSALAIAVAQAGGLGSLPCAALNAQQIRDEVARFRAAVSAPLNLNFFCHTPPAPDHERETRWRQTLAPYYREFDIAADTQTAGPSRAPFDEAACALVEELRPEVVSFHFGLPEAALVERVKRSGAQLLSSATTVAEARWLEARRCDAVIAQGSEAGGHRGLFLSGSPDSLDTQIPSLALLPQIAAAVRLPVIAAGGIMEGRGLLAARALGASAVQLGTAYLFCPEAEISALHRQALRDANERGTTLTRLFTGRPARGVVNRLMLDLGPMFPIPPEFPGAAAALAPLRAAAEARGLDDFSPLWSGQGAGLGRELPAADLTRRIAEEASL